MKKILCVLILLTIANPLFAAITFDVDILYWDIGRSPFTYTHASTPTTRQFCPDFDYGYRLGTTYRYRAWDAGLRYTCFNSSQERTTEKTTTTVNCKKKVDEEKMRYHLDFETLDFEVAYNWQRCFSCLIFRPFVGVKTAWVEESLRQTLTETHQHLKLRGYGLYLGSEGALAICHYYGEPLYFVTRLAYGVMDNKFKKSDRCLYQPYLNVFVGLKQSLGGLCNTNSLFMIGYEAQHFGEWDNFTQENKDSFGLGGLVVRLGFTY